MLVQMQAANYYYYLVNRATASTGNPVAWIAIGVSGLSLLFAALAWWINREKLRLDLYNRRFDICKEALQYYFFVTRALRPTKEEMMKGWSENSEKLREAREGFVRTNVESQFLFGADSDISKLLKQFADDAFGLVEFREVLAPQIRNQPEAFIIEYNKYLGRLKRLDDSLSALVNAASVYLNFHGLKQWNLRREMKTFLRQGG
jgi:hypothetical protein